MDFLIMAAGVFCVIVGMYIKRLSDKTPEDELVPWGCWAYRAHELADIQSVLALVIGVFIIIAGLVW